MKNLNGGQDKTAENDEDQEEIDDVEECKCFLLLWLLRFEGTQTHIVKHSTTLLAFSWVFNRGGLIGDMCKFSC